MNWKPPSQKTSFKSLKESGNMILALFGAVALVGTIGAGTSIIVNGPMKVMSQVNQTTQTEGQIMVAAKMVMLDVTNLTGSGDCDSDNLNEPREWRDASGVGPDGVADSDGGGFLPMAVGTSKRDAWGTQYGYCVWDHGAMVDDAGCGGAGQRRLQGFNSIDHPVVAIISAGPNRTFETPCRDFDNADNDSDNVLDYSAGDDPLIARGGDDVLIAYSYAEASEDNPGIWELDINADGEAVAVMDGSISDVEFTGSSASFGGTVELDGTEGLDIHDETVLMTCDASSEGQLRRNMGGASPQLEICEDTGGSVYAWSPMAVSGASPSVSTIAGAIADPVFDPVLANCTKNKGGPLELIATYTRPNTLVYQSIFVRDGYIFATGGSGQAGIDAFTFDGTNFTLLDSMLDGANQRDIFYENKNLYVSFRQAGLTPAIYSFSDQTFSLVDTASRSSDHIWSDGTFLFTTTDTNMSAFTFDGTTINEIANSPTNDINCGYVWGDGKYIYNHCNDLNAYEFDGTNFTHLASIANSNFQRNIGGDDNFIYTAESAQVRAYSFDGTSFSIEASYTPTGFVAHNVWSDGVYVYAGHNGRFDVLKKAGSSFIQVATDSSLTGDADVMGDGSYIYTIDDNKIHAYSGFTCTQAYVSDKKEDYIAKITVEQTGVTGSTIDSAGWSQTLASDTAADQTGIAFVVDSLASKSSAPTAAITASKDDASGASLVFKTKSVDGTINNAGLLNEDGYLGIGIDPSETSDLQSYYQIGQHSTALSDDFIEGLLVTSDVGTDQISYFGYYDDGSNTNTVLFSKDLKIKKTSLTGAGLREFIRFEQTQATRFFGDLAVEGSTQTVSIRNTSYSATDVNDGTITFKRKRVNEDDNVGTDLPLEDNDTVGRIEIKGSSGLDMVDFGEIEAKVDGTVVAGTVPTEIGFRVKQTNFDPVIGNCAYHGGSKQGEIVASTAIGNRFSRLWYQNGYIFTIEPTTDLVYAFKFNGESFSLIDTIADPGNIQEITGDGTYIYVGNQGGSIRAYSFDGTSFTYLDVATIQLDNNQGLWTKDGYIFAAADNWGVTAYTFDGTSFTFVDRFSAITHSIRDVWSDDDYVYAIDSTGGLYVLAFDGAAFSLVQHFNLYPNGHVFGYDGYIYVTHGSNVYVMTFDGINLNLIDTLYVQNAAAMWHDGIYLYVTRGSRGVAVVNFDGTTLTQHEIIDPISWKIYSVRGDGQHLFFPDENPGGLYAISGYECYSELKVAGNDNVGVQKEDPQSQLHVGGRILTNEGIRIGVVNTACTGADEGTLRFESNNIEACDGANWIPVSDAVRDTGPSLDCTPTPFYFGDIVDGATTTEYTSNGFVVGGLEADEECYLSLSGPAASKISKNGVDETSKVVSVQNGDLIKIKATTGAADTCVTNQVALGVQQASFSVGTGFGCKVGYPFDPENHNCVRNNGGPFSLLDSYATAGTTSDAISDGKYIYATDWSAAGTLHAFSFDGSSLSLIDTYDTGTESGKLWHDGQYIYVTNWTDGIRAFSFDGAILTEEAHYVDGTSSAGDVWGDGTYIYLDEPNIGNPGLNVFSFNGSSFTLLDTYNTSDSQGVWGDGTYLYVADRGAGIRAFSFDGSSLSLIDTYNTTGEARHIIGDRDYIYVADSASGVHAFTFNGSSFTLLDTYNTSGSAKKVWTDGSHVYVSDVTGGFHALSFDGSSFSLVNTYSSANAANSLFSDGEYIYGVDNANGLMVFSGFECTLADPLPTPVYEFFDPEAANCRVNEGGPFASAGTFNTANEAYSVWADTNYVFVADGFVNGVHAYSYNGYSFTLIDTFDTGGAVTRIWGDGTYIYIADFNNGVSAFTFDGSTLTQVGNYATAGAASDVWGDGTYIYATDNTSGVSALTFNGSTFALVDTQAATDAVSVWGDGEYIYVADQTTGFRVLNFNGVQFTEIELYNTAGDAQDIWGDGEYIYVADSAAGLTAFSFDGYSVTQIDDTTERANKVWADGTHIYTVADTGNMYAYTFNGTSFTLVDSDASPGFAENIWGNGDHIFVADYTSGIRAYSGFDCVEATPPIPEFDPDAGNCIANNGGDFALAGTYNTSGTAKGVWGNGNYTFVADDSSGVHAFTFDGSTFTLVDTYDTTGDARTLWSDGAYLYVADETGGIHALTFDGTTLALAGTYDNSSNFFSVWGEGEYIYIANAGAGVRALTFDGTTFTIEATYNTTGKAQGLWSGGGYVYVGDHDFGIHAFTFNGSSFNLVDTYDTTGNVYEVWSDGTYVYATDDTAGVHALSFDGSAFTLIDTYDTGGLARGIWGDGINIYVADGSDGVHAFSFNGTTLSLEHTYDTTDSALGVWGDGDYIYVADEVDGVHAFSGFECVASYEPPIPPLFDPDAGNCLVNAGGPFVEQDRVVVGQTYDGWSDGTYVYVTAGNRVRAYGYDGSTLTAIDEEYLGSTQGIWGDGTYIYATGSSSVEAYTFDGTTLTSVASRVLSDTQDVWGDGTYIYVADGTSGIRALSFNGSAFTLEDTYNTTGDANNIWGDGTYIYVADGTSGIHAFSFDGSSFTLEDTYNTANSARNISGDGTYIFLADGGGPNNLHAYTFDGSTFTQVATTTVGYAHDVWTDGAYVYSANGTGGIEAHSFNGTTFTSVGTSPGTALSIWGDGNGIYAGYLSSNDFAAFSGFECLVTE